MKWLISRIAEGCHQCRSAFSEGQDVFSTIVSRDSSDEGVVETERFDFCSSCWQARESGNPFWKCLFTPKSSEEPPALPDKDAVMALFLEKARVDQAGLPEEEKREISVIRYLLALMLERKKRLIPCQGASGGDMPAHVVFYRDAKSADIFQIEVPELSESDIIVFQQKITELLPLRNKRGLNRAETERKNTPE